MSGGLLSCTSSVKSINIAYYTIRLIILSRPGLYLEVVRRVAVSVLGYMQEDEEVLPEVVRHSGQPREAVPGEAESHHLSGWRSRGLDELSRQHCVMAFIQIHCTLWLPQWEYKLILLGVYTELQGSHQKQEGVFLVF